MFEEYRQKRTIKKILDKTPYLYILKNDVMIFHEISKNRDNSIVETKTESIQFELSNLENLVKYALNTRKSEIRINADYDFIHGLSNDHNSIETLNHQSERVGLSLILNLDSKNEKFSYRIINGINPDILKSNLNFN